MKTVGSGWKVKVHGGFKWKSLLSGSTTFISVKLQLNSIGSWESHENGFQVLCMQSALAANIRFISMTLNEFCAKHAHFHVFRTLFHVPPSFWVTSWTSTCVSTKSSSRLEDYSKPFSFVTSQSLINFEYSSSFVFLTNEDFQQNFSDRDVA